jgi:hypothetical protein
MRKGRQQHGVAECRGYSAWHAAPCTVTWRSTPALSDSTQTGVPASDAAALGLNSLRQHQDPAAATAAGTKIQRRLQRQRGQTP